MHPTIRAHFLEITDSNAGVDPKAQPAKPHGGGLPVEAAQVRVDTVRDNVTVVGSLLSNESVVVRPEIAGRIASFNIREGQLVKQGQELIEIEASVYEAELNEAKASLQMSRRDNARIQELFRKGVSTASTRDEALGRMEIDEARVALAETRLRKTVIKAPFTGILGFRHVSIGDYVTPGQDIVNIEDIDPVKVEFKIPETRLPDLAVGQPIKVRVDAYAGEGFEGEVYAIDPRIDAAGRSVAIRARVPNPDGRLRPGLFARVTLVVEERPSAMLVPETAIVPRGEAQQVFRVVDGKALLTDVRLGLRRDGWVEVVEGLAPDDVVVTAGQLKLRDGMPVSVSEPATAAPAA